MNTLSSNIARSGLAVLLIAFGALVGPVESLASADEETSAQIEFARVWAMVVKNDPTLRASSEESEASKIASDRASRHWYPRVYATGKAFETNDPATSFMFTLQQRQVGAADFAPSALNQPGSSFFEQGSLGLDLPLFEGGLKVAQAKAAEKTAAAKQWELKAQSISEFSRVAQDYASLLALREERRQLMALRESVTGVLEHYSIGSKSNLVGYSGLLGLKNLRNRIDGLLAQNEATSRAKRSAIRALAEDLPSSWEPKADRTKEFLTHVFPAGGPQSGRATPAAVEAARLLAESSESGKDGERARFLPKFGVFAQGDLYGGNRASATSYSSGAYLQWDLFSAPNFGTIGQAEHQAAAAQARAEMLAAQMKSGSEAAADGLLAAEKTLQLLDESAELLEEQTQTARRLFRDGSINALQLVEVLNRRADLLSNRRDAELMLAQTKAAVFSMTASVGVSK